MNASIRELKTRAKFGLKALRAGDTALLARAQQASGRPAFVPEAWQLRHALAVVAQCAGFQHWDHARVVLGGEAVRGEDMGRFWHAPACDVLLNRWFARYEQAAAVLRDAPDAALLPYGRQFIVAGPEYLREIGIPGAAGFDAVAEYGWLRWEQWCEARLNAMR